MDIKSFLVGLLGGAGFGSLILHFSKKWIDHYFDSRSSSSAERRAIQNKQSDLLREFLGEPWSKFIWLSKNLDLDDRQRKQRVAVEITNWLINHRPYFPGDIQFIFSQVALGAFLLANDHPALMRNHEDSLSSTDKKLAKDRWVAESTSCYDGIDGVESLGLLLGEPLFVLAIRQELEKYIHNGARGLGKY